MKNDKVVCIDTHNLTVDYVEGELATQLKIGFITLKKPIKGEYIIVEVKTAKSILSTICRQSKNILFYRFVCKNSFAFLRQKGGQNRAEKI